MEEVHEIRRATRDGFIAADALELAVKGAVVAELIAADDLDGAQRAEARVPCQLDFAVSAAADRAQQFVVGGGGQKRGVAGGLAWQVRAGWGRRRCGGRRREFFGRPDSARLALHRT